MSTLHQLNRLASIDACQPATAATDSILLIEEAVSIMLQPHAVSRLSQSAAAVYVLGTDAQARGIQLPAEPGNIKALPVEDWIALCISHDRVVSW